jgi:hypothetical protein
MNCGLIVAMCTPFLGLVMVWPTRSCRAAASNCYFGVLTKNSGSEWKITSLEQFEQIIQSRWDEKLM